MPHTLLHPHRRVQATVVRRPTHVGSDYHHETHLDSLVGLGTEALLHHDPHPDSNMVLVPAVQAIKAMLESQRLVGAYYWLEVWRRQQLQGETDYHNYFAIPTDCCEVTDHPHPLVA